MSLREEIKPFTDADGLVAPGIVNPTDSCTSDNGPMFTSEYYLLLALRGELQASDVPEWRSRILQCFKEPGLLCRVPVKYGTLSQEGPDDYYGVLAASSVLDHTVAEAILSYGQSKEYTLEPILNYVQTKTGDVWYIRLARRLFGSIKVRYNFNNVDNVLTPESWMGRQPQLVAAMHFAAQKKCPLLLRIYTALVIATSCMGAPPSDTDGRRLAWLLICTAAPKCWMSRIASRIWYFRLKRDYPGKGMRGVAELYYQGNHPFKTYHLE